MVFLVSSILTWIIVTDYIFKSIWFGAVRLWIIVIYLTLFEDPLGGIFGAAPACLAEFLPSKISTNRQGRWQEFLVWFDILFEFWILGHLLFWMQNFNSFEIWNVATSLISFLSERTKISNSVEQTSQTICQFKLYPTWPFGVGSVLFFRRDPSLPIKTKCYRSWSHYLDWTQN